jgi:hypothetical protein
MDLLTKLDQQHGEKFLFSIQWPAWLNTRLGSQAKSSIVIPEASFPIGKIQDEQSYSIMDSVLTQFPDSPWCVLPNAKETDIPLIENKEKKPIPSTLFSETHHLDLFLKKLEKIFRHELKFKPTFLFSWDTHFNDLGVDSILLADLIKRLEAELSIFIPPTTFMDHPTLRKIGQYLWDNCRTEHNRRGFEESEIIKKQGAINAV